MIKYMLRPDAQPKYLAIILLAFMAGCDLEKIESPGGGSLKAVFSVPSGAFYQDCNIIFTNSSTGGTSYLWDFGDGSTSTAQSPEHTYTSSGTFPVELTVSSNGSSADTTIQITVFAKTIFNKSHFPGATNNEGNSVIAVNGGYVIAGEVLTTGTPEKAYLYKTDPNGTVSWSQSFGTGNYQTASFVTQLSDGSLLLVGTISGAIGSQGEDIYLVKTDAGGNKLWERNFGTTAGNDDYGNAAVQLSNGSFVIVGESGGDHLIMGADVNGNKTWEKIINKNTQDFLHSAVVTSDNKVLVSGITGTGNDNNYYLAKIDPANNGSVVWENTYGGNGYEEQGRLIALSDGNFLLSGSSNSTGSSKAFLVKVNGTGNKLWEKHIGQDSYGYAAAETADGGFVITGFSYQLCAAGQCPDAYLAKTDASGNVIWEKGLLGETGRDVKIVDDCGYIVIGRNSTGFYLVKTDMNGNFQ